MIPIPNTIGVQLVIFRADAHGGVLQTHYPIIAWNIEGNGSAIAIGSVADLCADEVWAFYWPDTEIYYFYGTEAVPRTNLIARARDFLDLKEKTPEFNPMSVPEGGL